ncbi:MAG TPA: hypothetical protein VL752_19220 [Acidisoma sp.]|uniref:hypothetical protein n=1 Tax=Acidisoma sp. TaxID=1872115 RepID=UPI002C0222C0|nr:hypothetical protein [Acidisoma sp.]HTI03084.1 hypothetical protein [Acidisoma sp.]
MKKTKPPSARPPARRPRDTLLLPLALLLVLFELILQTIARLLRHFGPLRRLEALLATLPAWAIVPLFLIPEAMSHIGGFYAAYLLAHRKIVAATMVAVLVKGVGLVVALWIYQACRPALMTIGWFAWLHGKVGAARAWAMIRIGPPLARVRGFLAELRGLLPWGRRPAEPGAAHSGRRLAAIRVRLRRHFGAHRFGRFR